MIKLPNKKNKRKMLDFYTMAHKVTYLEHRRLVLNVDNKKMYASAYELDKHTPQNIIDDFIENYDNTKVLDTYCEYAPEIKKRWIVLVD